MNLEEDGNGSVTVRDYFAGLAMQELIKYYIKYGNVLDLRESPPNPQKVAIAAYLYADAMIKARDK